MNKIRQMEKKTKYILYGLGAIAIIGTGAFAYLQYQKALAKTNNNSVSDAFSTASLPLPAPTPTKPNRSTASGGFPLRKGSRGALVKNLQNALIKKFGAGILPRYGADGGFGTETLNALISKGLPAVVTSEVFSKLITSSGGNSIPYSSQSSPEENLSNRLREAIISGSFSRAIDSLKQIKNVPHYQHVGDIFKKERIGATRKTIVTALLYRFPSAAQKKVINNELYRMGLKYDGSKWALKGMHGISIDQLVTIESTKVWDETGQSMNVPKSTVLGEYLDANNGVTEFETLDRKRLFVKTTSISYTS